MAHIDLDELQPEGHTFKFKDVTYKLPGRAPVETVVRGVILDEKLKVAAMDDDADAVKEAAEEMYALVTDLMRDADPDVNLGAVYTAEQRHTFAQLVSRLGAEVDPDDVSDAMLAEAGVEPTPGLRLTLSDLVRIMALVGGGKAAADAIRRAHEAEQAGEEALADTVQAVLTGQEPEYEKPPEGGVPPTKPAAKRPARTRSVSGKAPGSAKRSRSRSSG